MIRIIDLQNELFGDTGSPDEIGGSALVSGSTVISATPSAFTPARGYVLGSTVISASGTVKNTIPHAHVVSSTSILAAGSFADLGVLGSAIVASSTTIEAIARAISVFGARVNGKTTITARATRDLAADDSLVLYIQRLGMASDPLNPYLNQGAKLEINGDEIPIKSFILTERSDSNGYDLELELSGGDLDDFTDLLTGLDTFVFYLGTRPTPGGVYEWEQIINTDFLSSRNYSTSFKGRALRISIGSGLGDRLKLCPRKFITVYDPDKTTVNLDSIEPIQTETGSPVGYQAIARPTLSLYDVFTRSFIAGCGFAGFETNIPNYRIEQVTYSPLESYLDSIRGLFGVFDPVIFDRDNKIVLLETTQVLPPDFEPVELVSGDFKAYDEKRSRGEKIDGLVINYTRNKIASNAYRQRFVEPPPDISTDDQGNETEHSVKTEYWDYYDPENVSVVVDTVLKSETTTIKVNGAAVSRETETYFFNSRGHQMGSEKLIRAFVPLPVNDFEGSLELVKREASEIVYKSSTTSPAKLMQSRIITRISALVATDNTNTYFGEPFKQELLEAHRPGNLKSDMNYSLGLEPVKTIIRTFSDDQNGQVRATTRTIDHLRGTPVEPISETLPGDAVLVDSNRVPARLWIWREGVDPDNPGNRVEQISLGEIPIKFGKPLAKRALEVGRFSPEPPRDGTIEMSGFDWKKYRKGSTWKVKDRGVDRINVIVLGRTITGQDLGTPGQNISTRLEVTEVR